MQILWTYRPIIFLFKNSAEGKQEHILYRNIYDIEMLIKKKKEKER